VFFAMVGETLETLLQANGATGLQDLAIEEFEIGRGLKTKRSFQAGQSILSLPISLCWKAQDILDHPQLSVIGNLELQSDDMLAILLMYHRVYLPSTTIRDKVWKAHLEYIPKEYSNSIFYDKEALNWAKGSSLYTVDAILREQNKQDYLQLVSKVFLLHPNIFPLSSFTFELYQWALCTIWSRGMDFVVPQNGQALTLRTIVPFMDLINGSQHVNQCHRLHVTSGKVEVIAGMLYKPNDQIFINYGTISNARLCRLYGFVFEENDSNDYRLYLSTNPDSPYYEQKQMLFSKYGMEPETSFALTDRDPLPETLLQYLRIQRANEQELSILNNPEVRKLNDRNECEVLSSLRIALEAILQEFHTLSELKSAMQLDSDSRNCAIVALGERLILDKALREVLNGLKKLK
jgi:hypothetical protein